jgi:hypothetical protein
VFGVVSVSVPMPQSTKLQIIDCSESVSSPSLVLT